MGVVCLLTFVMEMAHLTGKAGDSSSSFPSSAWFASPSSASSNSLGSFVSISPMLNSTLILSFPKSRSRAISSEPAMSWILHTPVDLKSRRKSGSPASEEEEAAEAWVSCSYVSS